MPFLRKNLVVLPPQTSINMKIRVVDAEIDIQTLFQQCFRREIRSGELSFAFALSGEAALTYLAAHSSEVILILSDINMPGMSRIELLRRIRIDKPSAPPKIMMITAYNNRPSHLIFTTLRQKLTAEL